MDKITWKDEARRLLGVGLRPFYYKDFIANSGKADSLARPFGWIEVHPENYFAGGYDCEALAEIAPDYSLSFHGVGLSLGSAEGLRDEHLKKLKLTVERFSPQIVSEHLSWSKSGNAHLHDLLPLPYTKEVVAVLIDNINRAQDFLGRKIAVENPSLYIGLDGQYTETEVLHLILEATGCELLLDVNNIYVSSQNLKFDPVKYLDQIDVTKIAEVHLAGHISNRIDNGEVLLIDTHNQPVSDPVWDLYRRLLRKKGFRAFTMLEWDSDFPSYAQLSAEVSKAAKILDSAGMIEGVLENQKVANA